MDISETIKTPIEWSELAEDFLDADGNIFRASHIADALNTATAREARLVDALEALVKVLPIIAKESSVVYHSAYIHGVRYTGPTWEKELKEAAKVLAEYRGEK